MASQITISASTLALHHDATVFNDPYSFQPGRWMQAEPAHRVIMDKHYMPFGYGARFCLGSNFALVQIKILVALTVLQVELRQDANSPTDYRSMSQLDTQNALPRGLRCDIAVRRVNVPPRGQVNI